MKLHDRLVAKIAPVALPENTVTWRDYRVTVLSDRLFRVEKAPDGVFNDAATQSVWFRNMPAQCFDIKEEADRLTVTTKRTSLILAPDFADCRVVLEGISHPLANDAENLKGTSRTLDGYNGEYHISDGHRKQLRDGVCSKSGVAVVDDTGTLCLGADGQLTPAALITSVLYFAERRRDE